MITEDMPGWDCSTMGNLICGLPDTSIAPPTNDVGGLLMIGILLVTLAIVRWHRHDT